MIIPRSSDLGEKFQSFALDSSKELFGRFLTNSWPLVSGLTYSVLTILLIFGVGFIFIICTCIYTCCIYKKLKRKEIREKCKSKKNKDKNEKRVLVSKQILPSVQPRVLSMYDEVSHNLHQANRIKFPSYEPAVIKPFDQVSYVSLKDRQANSIRIPSLHLPAISPYDAVPNNSDNAYQANCKKRAPKAKLLDKKQSNQITKNNQSVSYKKKQINSNLIKNS